MVLNDMQIQALCEGSEMPMISPFQPQQVRQTESGAVAISSGLSSFGYDIRLSDQGLKIFDIKPDCIIDPKDFNDSILIEQDANFVKDCTAYLLLPNTYALGVSVETFDIPVNILGICYCKSTYARCGLMVNTTPLEPGWRGELVIEMRNLTDSPIIVYANEGIAQVVFFDGPTPWTTYADRSGKYQDQRGIVTAKV